jgi:outer membrane protein
MRSLIKIAYLVIMVGVFNCKLDAQDSLQHTYSLQQCVDIAIQNNPDVKNAEFKMQSNNVSVQQAKANAYPGLSGNITHGINQGRSINPYTNSYLDQQINTAQYSLNAGVVLWNGASIKNNIKQNNLNYEAGKKDVEQTKNDLTINVILAYLQVLSYRDQLQLAVQQAAVTKKQVERLDLLNKDGAIAPSTLYDQKGQLGNDELNIISSKNALETAKITLVQFMNIPYASDMQLEKINKDVLIKYNVTIDEIYKQASQQLALVKAAELRNKSAAVSVAVAKGQLLPTLSLNGSLGTNYSNAATTLQYLNTSYIATSDYVLINNVKTNVYASQDNYNNEKIPYGSQWKNNLNSYVGIGLQIPLFNAAKLRSQVKLAKISEQQSNIQFQTITIHLRQSIEQAYINMNTAYERFQMLDQQVKDYTESFRAATIKFEAGAITSVDYIIAKNNVDRANTNLIASKYDYILKTKILDYYMGKSLV